jgi:membrane-associated phospholipid phosphatase
MEKLLQSDSISIKKIKEGILSLSTMLCLFPLNIFYITLNNSKRGSRSLILGIDSLIPFIEIFIIPYLAWYAFIFLTMAFLCFKDRKTYFITLISYGFGLIASNITFFFFQTTVPRPELIGNGLFTRMVQMVYGADQPYNCFPSIHVLTSYLMVKAIMCSSVKNKTNTSVILMSAIMIIVSTLFVKQHVVLDVAAGILYGEVLFRLSQDLSIKIYKILKTVKSVDRFTFWEEKEKI